MTESSPKWHDVRRLGSQLRLPNNSAEPLFRGGPHVCWPYYPFLVECEIADREIMESKYACREASFKLTEQGVNLLAAGSSLADQEDIRDLER